MRAQNKIFWGIGAKKARWRNFCEKLVDRGKKNAFVYTLYIYLF